MYKAIVRESPGMMQKQQAAERKSGVLDTQGFLGFGAQCRYEMAIM